MRAPPFGKATRSRSTPDRVLIGAHVPLRGSLFGAIDSAKACGAETVQIWGSNPRAWAPPRIDPERSRDFAAAWREAGLGPLFIHAPYMVNVASPNQEFRRRSVDLARATLTLAEQIEAAGVVIHAGAAGAGTERSRAIKLAARSLLAIATASEHSVVLIELTAGGAGSVASTFEQAEELLDAAEGDPRLALCADTCHLFATGYALDSKQGVDSCFRELRRRGLAQRLRLVHANDSKFPRGEHRDSHTHIGQGYIGEVGFRAILADPTVRRCPLVCETPGRLEDHARNIATLRRLSSRSR
jgi:deoxyribonuclease IV